MSSDDGRADFDFIHGHWRVRHRRLTDMLDPACTTWRWQTGTSHATPILGGYGNVDRLWIPGAEPPFEGVTLRLFDPAERVWRIWWSSTARAGILDPPMEGRFDDGVGTFEHDEVVDGIPIGVRFSWRETRTPAPRWEQEFSFDGGASWKLNWVMELSRPPADTP
jgi:hypothetical protein